jgi:hypothetical protein
MPAFIHTIDFDLSDAETPAGDLKSLPCYPNEYEPAHHLTPDRLRKVTPPRSQQAIEETHQ